MVGGSVRPEAGGRWADSRNGWRYPMLNEIQIAASQEAHSEYIAETMTHSLNDRSFQQRERYHRDVGT